MAGKTGTIALQTAIQGGKVSDEAAQSALGDAVGRIANLTKRAQNSKEAMMETGTLVLHTAEMQGSLFPASLAEGYFGEDKLKLGSVDLRASAGIAQGYGLYQTCPARRAPATSSRSATASWALLARQRGPQRASRARREARRRIPRARLDCEQPTGTPAPMVVMRARRCCRPRA